VHDLVATPPMRAGAATEGGPAATGWVDVGPVDALKGGRRITAEVSGVPVLVLRTRRRIIAILNRCPHLQRDLADAHVRGSVLECQGHRFRWNVVSGEPLPCWRGRAASPLTGLDVRVETGRVLVAVDGAGDPS
jgi:nitrite reductase/ring-hydroxylating ferredoxin subunit